MIVMVCGLIGSGKSTWAERQKGIVSDFDIIGDKRNQILFTLSKHKQGEIVYHITYYPTFDEQIAFDGEDKKYIWINTTMNQCWKNIIARGRRRDIVDISDTLDCNESILLKYLNGNIPFEVIDVFESSERW
mgnify:CR=1 FL=1